MGFGTEIIFAFEYDAVSNTFRPADLSDEPPQGHDAKCGYVCQTMAQKRDYVCHGIRDEVRIAKPTRLTTSISNCSSNEPDKRFGERMLFESRPLPEAAEEIAELARRIGVNVCIASIYAPKLADCHDRTLSSEVAVLMQS